MAEDLPCSSVVLSLLLELRFALELSMVYIEALFVQITTLIRLPAGMFIAGRLLLGIGGVVVGAIGPVSKCD